MKKPFEGFQEGLAAFIAAGKKAQDAVDEISLTVDGAEFLGAKAIKVTYTNHRGEIALRNVVPMRIWFGLSEWHVGERWLMTVWDTDKKELREFALSECDFTKSHSE